MIDHEDDIMARPARSWFQTPKQKKAVADAAKATATGRGPAATSDEKASKKAADRDGKMKRGSRVQQEPEDTAEEKRAVSRGIRWMPLFAQLFAPDNACWSSLHVSSHQAESVTMVVSAI